jgi:hypothetical protein
LAGFLVFPAEPEKSFKHYQGARSFKIFSAKNFYLPDRRGQDKAS